MKKFIKFCLVFATILCVFGFLLSGCSLQRMMRNHSFQFGDLENYFPFYYFVDEETTKADSNVEEKTDYRIPVEKNKVEKGYHNKMFEIVSNEIIAVKTTASNKKIVFAHSSANLIKVEYLENEYETYNIYEEKGTLHIAYKYKPHIGLNWDAVSAFFKGDAINQITIYLPEEYSGNIMVDTSNGAIEMENFSKLQDVFLDTSNGKIELYGLQMQKLIAKTSNGKLSLNKINATELDAKTSNGKILFENIKAPIIKLHSSNGKIEGTILGKESEYAITSSTSNGNNNLKNRGTSTASNQLDVSTSNSEISVLFR